MPINYDVEYPKLQRKITALQAEIEALREMVLQNGLNVNSAQNEIISLRDSLKDCRETVKFTNSYENVTAIVNRALLEKEVRDE